MQTRKVVNDIFKSYIDASEDGPLKAALSQSSAKFREALTEPFYSPKLKRPLGDVLEKTSSVYEQHADVVRSAEKLVSQDTGAQTFVNQLLSKNPAAGQSRKALADELVDLIGPKASSHIDEMRTNHAIRAFTSKLGNPGPLVPGVLKPAVGALSSPRAARSIVGASNNVGNFLKNIGPKGREELLRDARYSEAMLGILTNSAQEEEQMTQELTDMGVNGL
jgi:hypothetical protein